MGQYISNKLTQVSNATAAPSTINASFVENSLHHIDETDNSNDRVVATEVKENDIEQAYPELQLEPEPICTDRKCNGLLLKISFGLFIATFSVFLCVLSIKEK